MLIIDFKQRGWKNRVIGDRKYLIFPNVCFVERIEKWRVERVEKLFCLEKEGANFSHYSNVARIKSFLVPFSFGYY